MGRDRAYPHVHEARRAEVRHLGRLGVIGPADRRSVGPAEGNDDEASTPARAPRIGFPPVHLEVTRPVFTADSHQRTRSSTARSISSWDNKKWAKTGRAGDRSWI